MLFRVLCYKKGDKDMLVKSITYKDLDDNDITEDFYFRLSKSEVAEWLTATGGNTLDNVLKRLTQTHNMKEAMEIYKDIIKRSYGIRGANGRSFEKSEEAWLNFYQSDAYSELFMEFIQDVNKFTEFLDGIIPPDIKNAIDEVNKNNPAPVIPISQ